MFIIKENINKKSNKMNTTKIAGHDYRTDWNIKKGDEDKSIKSIMTRCKATESIRYENKEDVDLIGLMMAIKKNLPGYVVVHHKLKTKDIYYLKISESEKYFEDNYRKSDINNLKEKNDCDVYFNRFPPSAYHLLRTLN